MQTLITGKAYVLGDNVDTDQIIPAHYLSFNPATPEERRFFGMYANSGVPDAQAGLPRGNVPFVRPKTIRSIPPSARLRPLPRPAPDYAFAAAAHFPFP